MSSWVEKVGKSHEAASVKQPEVSSPGNTVMIKGVVLLRPLHLIVHNNPLSVSMEWLNAFVKRNTWPLTGESAPGYPNAEKQYLKLNTIICFGIFKGDDDKRIYSYFTIRCDLLEQLLESRYKRTNTNISAFADILIAAYKDLGKLHLLYQTTFNLPSYTSSEVRVSYLNEENTLTSSQTVTLPA